MPGTHSPEEKDRILTEAFGRLKARGIGSAWASNSKPYSALFEESARLVASASFRDQLGTYLRIHTVLRRSVLMLFTSVSMAASAQWQQTPADIRAVAARGWFLGRWIPTFLIVDGPIGRFFCGSDSPLSSFYGEAYPVVTAARDFLNDRLFRLLRNSFAHWAFDWEVVGGQSYVIAYDDERDLPTAKMHQLECDAYHIIAFAIVEVLNDVFIHEP